MKNNEQRAQNPQGQNAQNRGQNCKNGPQNAGGSHSGPQE